MHATILNAASLFSAARADIATGQRVRMQSGNAPLLIAQGQHLHIHIARSHVITAERGTLWITQDGQLRDWILESGQSQGFDGNADLLITAMSDASLRVEREG